MRDPNALKSAQDFIRTGEQLLDTIQLRIVELKAHDEEETEDEIEKLKQQAEDLEIAISRTQDITGEL